MFDIVAVTESWLSNVVCSSEILPLGFIVYRKDRPSRGVGVMLAINCSIFSMEVPSPDHLEVVSVHVIRSSKAPLVFCVVYVPPNPDYHYCSDLLDYLATLISVHDVVLLGDFNVPDINWSTLSGQSTFSQLLCDFIFQSNLVQLITCPTHIKGNVLLVNSHDIVSDLEILSYLNFSDHFPITFNVHSCMKDNTKPSSSSPTLNYSKIDYNGLTSYLLTYDFDFLYQSSDIEFVWSSLKSIILESIYSFTPTVKRHKYKFPRWYTPEIRHEINKLRTLRKLAKRSNCSKGKSVELAESLLRKKMLDSKLAFESKLVNDFVISKNSQIFKYIGSLSKTRDLPSTVYLGDKQATTAIDKATLFNTYFQSVFNAECPTLSPLRDISFPDISLSNISFTDFETFTALSSLDPTKSMGCDGIPPSCS